MPLPADLKLLDADLPACPRALLDLLVLLNDENAPVSALAAVIERDMALAASVVRTVNSAMYGLLRRVETVHEAVRFLGTREVAAITFSSALRAAFPATPQLEVLWDRSSRGGLLMGRSASALDLDPWRAHSAGLFARCGQAVLMAKFPQRYPLLLSTLGDADDLAELVQAEQDAFGVDHAVYGSALCAAWGLAADVVKFVRQRVDTPSSWDELPAPLADLLTLGRLTEQVLDGIPPEVASTDLAGQRSRTDARRLAGAIAGPWTQLAGSGTARSRGTPVH